MTAKQIEKRIEQAFSVVNELQNRALSLSRKRLAQALQGEIAARRLATTIFDDGLSFLGKGVVYGRKVKETFSASTNKKTSRLQRLLESDFSDAERSELTKESMLFQGNGSAQSGKRKKSAKNLAPKSHSMKKMAARTKKSRVHPGPVARSH